MACLSIFVLGIFTHSSLPNASSSVMFLGCLTCTACSMHGFQMMFKSGTVRIIPKASTCFSCSSFKVCFGSLSCCRSQPLFSFGDCALEFYFILELCPEFYFIGPQPLFWKCFWFILMFFHLLQTLTFVMRRVRFIFHNPSMWTM